MARPPSPAVVLTREHEDNLELMSELRDRGVPVREIPCVATRYTQPDTLPAGRFHAVTFTSRRGVRGAARQALLGQLLPAGADVLVAAVGRATAQALEANGVHPDLIADPPEGRVLAALLSGCLDPGGRILMVRGSLRAGGLDSALDEAGYHLEPVIVYENLEPGIPRLAPFPVAAVFCASPSAAGRLLEKNPWFGDHPFYVIGATTRAALAERGIARVTVMGAEPGDWIAALVEAHHVATQLEEP